MGMFYASACIRCVGLHLKGSGNVGSKYNRIKSKGKTILRTKFKTKLTTHFGFEPEIGRKLKCLV